MADCLSISNSYLWTRYQDQFNLQCRESAGKAVQTACPPGTQFCAVYEFHETEETPAKVSPRKKMNVEVLPVVHGQYNSFVIEDVTYLGATCGPAEKKIIRGFDQIFRQVTPSLKNAKIDQENEEALRIAASFNWQVGSITMDCREFVSVFQLPPLLRGVEIGKKLTGLIDNALPAGPLLGFFGAAHVYRYPISPEIEMFSFGPRYDERLGKGYVTVGLLREDLADQFILPHQGEIDANNYSNIWKQLIPDQGNLMLQPDPLFDPDSYLIFYK